MTYSIIDFGAAAGGETLCTAAIQAAIESCPRAFTEPARSFFGAMWSCTFSTARA